MRHNWAEHSARVYKNLNNGLWSIKQKVEGKWIVVGHAAQVEMVNNAAYVSSARHDHVRKGNHREVFAWIEGELIAVEGFVSYRGRVPVVSSEVEASMSTDDLMPFTFHPFDDVKRGFYWHLEDGRFWEDFDYAWRCYFDGNGKCWGFA